MEPAGGLRESWSGNESQATFESGNRSTTAIKPAEHIKVLFDARKLFEGGIGSYIYNTLAGLTACGNRPTIIIARNKFELLKKKSPHWLDQLSPLFDDSAGYSLQEYLFMLRRINQNDFDLYHSPHYTLPFGLKIPSVVTIHDLIHITHPQRFFYPWLARPLIKSALKRASSVISVSQASAADLSRHFSISATASKIVVIENSLNPEWLSDITVHNPQLKFEQYFFSMISTDKPHKGITDLLSAYRMYLRQTGKNACALVLAGQAFKNVKKFYRLIDGMGLNEHVEILGALDFAALQSLYAYARAVVLPSYAEGFGLAMLEAHAFRVPVVFRPVPALKEIALTTDFEAEDFSITALSSAIIRAATENRNKAALFQEFEQQYKSKFDIKNNALRLLQVYRSVIAGAD